MTRVKRGTVKNRRHKKVLKEARGYTGSKSRLSNQPSSRL